MNFWLIFGIAVFIGALLLAIASDWLISLSPWDRGDAVIRWLKPGAWHLVTFAAGLIVASL